MKVRALRGVCIGVGQHLSAGDTAELDSATVQFLVSIGAVEPVKDEPPNDADSGTPDVAAAADGSESEIESRAGKSRKKEK